jgi:SWI/SNF-related matrix-associated actin-dependent regulator 1 of chromatin subfamily A
VGLKQALNDLRAEIDLFYRNRLKELKKVNEQNVLDSAAGPANKADPDIPSSRKAALIEMYKRTGQVKIPLVAEMLILWLENPAKGKLCIFAHHISVLNEIGSIARLSNDTDSPRKFIRIDGATNSQAKARTN